MIYNVSFTRYVTIIKSYQTEKRITYKNNSPQLFVCLVVADTSDNNCPVGEEHVITR